MKDLYHDLKAELSLNIADQSAAGDGDAIIDLQGYNGALIIGVSGGTMTDSVTLELEEGDASDLSDGAAVADADLLGSEPTLDGTNQIKTFGYVGNKRYIRVNVGAVGTTGGIAGAAVAKGYPRHAPAV